MDKIPEHSGLPIIPLFPAGSQAAGKEPPAQPDRAPDTCVLGMEVPPQAQTSPEKTPTPEKEPESPAIQQSKPRESVPVAIAAFEELQQPDASLISRVTGAISSGWDKITNFMLGSNHLERYREITARINELEPRISSLTDEQLKAKTAEFSERIKNEQASGKELPAILDQLLPEAYAVMREADKRILSMRPFDVQVMAGVGMHEGMIVEQKTGEGKTLMETLPVYLNALAGKGVHVVTVNEYLAGRDAEWMGKAFEFMGLSVGVIKRDMSQEERKKANQADVTYGTNDEFGFQYLKDNLVHEKESKAGRDLKDVFAIVDEVDSILIDEARTPLIISRQSNEEPPPYGLFAELAQHLVENYDYTVDRKDHCVVVTEKGNDRIEKMLGVDNLYTDQNAHLISYVMNSITAKALYNIDDDYVVKDNEVEIVDEFTGRLMPGRRYSEGLHEAIEAKEGITVKPRTETLAMITYQNYFKLYGKMAGMTGTAESANKEFAEVFGKEVVVIPTNKPVIRKDIPDLVYKTEKEKFEAVARLIKELHQKGQPALIGTRSIEKSEELSNILTSMGIPHQVLNAKNHAREAEIIAQAGRPGMVTVATNMAGRGVDIKLGGDSEKLASSKDYFQEILKSTEEGGDPDKLARLESQQTGESYEALMAKYKKLCDEDKKRVKANGGLAVIGTERHEDRRIDDQLRGRSGRQGDPGVSMFFVSLEDELIRLFAGDKVKRLADKLGLPYGEPIRNRLITKAIEIAQEKCQDRNLDVRKNLMRYDWVMNTQREIVYSDRDTVLEGEDLRPMMMDMIDRAVSTVVERNRKDDGKLTADTLKNIDGDMGFLISEPAGLLKGKKFKDPDELKDYLAKQVKDLYAKREERFGGDMMRILERDIFLSILDENWVTQQTDLKDLRDGIWLRAYGEKDPNMEYINEAHTMFDSMKDNISIETLRTLFSLRCRGPQQSGKEEASKKPKTALKPGN